MSRLLKRPACVAASVILIAGMSLMAREGGAQETRPDSSRARRPARSSSRIAALSRDSATVIANKRYGASGFHRRMLGDGWRDVWQRPIKVPVIDLARFAGGLEAKEVGGGMQTRSLRFESAEQGTWTFRPLYKAKLAQLEAWEGTVVMDLLRDGLSANFPAAPVVAPPFLDAARVMHPTPILVVLPDDERLGEFRKEFAGQLGTIEEHVSDTKDDEEDEGFANSDEVIDSEKLLKRMNESAADRIAEREYLRARLIDILLNDNDRHADQWKWARRTKRDSLWRPIPRDRDRALVDYGGVLISLARRVKPNLIGFDSAFASPVDAAGHELDLDARLLSSLDGAAWREEIARVTQAVTNDVIDAGISRLPRGYASVTPRLTSTLRVRRDRLADVALPYYAILSRIVDVHATDSADVATVERSADSSVTLTIRRPGGAPWYRRRFLAAETEQLRVWLHGGDDSASVIGQGAGSLLVRVIGGNGRNALVDSSASPKGARPRLYDRGEIVGVDYGADSAMNRRPLAKAYGRRVEPPRNWGTSTGPIASFGTGRGLGIVPGVGIARTQYGFRRVPYASRASLLAQYSTGVSGWRVSSEVDVRREESKLFYLVNAEWSQLELVRFRGFGNDLPYSTDRRFDVRQQLLVARPALGVALGPSSELTVGPIVKHARADSTAGQYIAELAPLGFPRFGEVGADVQLRVDTRDNPSNPSRGWRLMAGASAFPAMWDVERPFQRLSATASTYLPMPVRKGSVLALRAGGEKIFGDQPYFESAFLGGNRTLRADFYQHYAGDASLFGNAELRVPVARVPLWLPWDIGALGYAESGRVFVNGESDGGWHSTIGAGLWIGVLGPAVGVNVLVTNSRARRLLFGTGVNF